MKNILKKIALAFVLCSPLGQGAMAQSTDPDLNGMRAIGTPANPKVKWTWNYYMDYAAFNKLTQELAKAYPDLVKYESIGKSYQGREMYVITITDFKSGKPEQKPAFWIDGNIHANELQGTQFAMYTAWYLAESFGKMDFVTDMLKGRTFYILPSLNPDAHENFIYKSNTTSSSRSGMMPLDDDGDGLVDEDGYDDLDGDGNIVTMRRKSPTGRYKIDPEYPGRMILAKPDEQGEYELLGFEGIDNDEVNVITSESDDKLKAVIKLDNFFDSYLIISSYVDRKVINHMEKAVGSANEYKRLQNNIDKTQLRFLAIFIIFTSISDVSLDNLMSLIRYYVANFTCIF